MKAFITKYALSAGIQEFDDFERSTEAPSMISRANKHHTDYFHVEGRDWHLTIESAVKRANEMRYKKIASLRKQLKKLEEFRFDSR